MNIRAVVADRESLAKVVVRWMRPFLALLFVCVASSGARAAPFSIQCDGGKPQQFYFLSLDLDTRRVVFEGALPIANMYAGEIKLVVEGRVEISLKANQGNVDLIWDEKNSKLIWVGLPGDTIRPLLVHSCAVTALRSAVSQYGKPETTKPFSVQCESSTLPTPAFLTIDEMTKVVVLDIPHGRTFRGEVSSSSDKQLVFELSGQSGTIYTWNKELSV